MGPLAHKRSSDLALLLDFADAFIVLVAIFELVPKFGQRGRGKGCSYLVLVRAAMETKRAYGAGEER